MKRSVAQAERWYEDTEPILSLEAKSAAMSEINRAKARARQFSEGVVQDIANKTDAIRSELLQELCEVRDGYAQLAKDGKAGKLSASEFLQRMNELEGRQASVANDIALVTQDAANAEHIEEDPVTYGDDILSRQPENQFDFSF